MLNVDDDWTMFLIEKLIKRDDWTTCDDWTIMTIEQFVTIEQFDDRTIEQSP